MFANVVSRGLKNVNNTISYAVVIYLGTNCSANYDGTLNIAGDPWNVTEISTAFEAWLRSNTSAPYDALGTTDVSKTS